MSSDPAIIFYDISSTLEGQPWNPNTWKARAVLNYKRIPYRTVWVAFPDIKSLLLKLGGAPTTIDPDGNPYYTLPAIVDNTSGTPVIVTDSLRIAEYLDEKYPERPVFPRQGKALEYAFEQAFYRIVASHILPSSWDILDDRSLAYFRETRERWYGGGKPLEEWSPEGPIREGHWEALGKAWEQIATILDQNGPDAKYFAGGKEPTRADMIVMSYLAWMRATVPDDWEKRVRHWSSGRWEKFWEASAEWRESPVI